MHRVTKRQGVFRAPVEWGCLARGGLRRARAGGRLRACRGGRRSWRSRPCEAPTPATRGSGHGGSQLLTNSRAALSGSTPRCLPAVRQRKRRAARAVVLSLPKRAQRARRGARPIHAPRQKSSPQPARWGLRGSAGPRRLPSAPRPSRACPRSPGTWSRGVVEGKELKNQPPQDFNFRGKTFRRAAFVWAFSACAPMSSRWRQGGSVVRYASKSVCLVSLLR